MASQLTFDNAVLGANTITTAMMVRGGTYNPEVSMAQVNTADGKTHQVPSHKGGSASCKLYGDKLSCNTAVGLGVTVSLLNASAAIFAGTGLVSASYDEADNTTSIEIKIDPTVDSES
jgi:hypothetical protein